jgi:hypothetical protein
VKTARRYRTIQIQAGQPAFMLVTHRPDGWQEIAPRDDITLDLIDRRRPVIMDDFDPVS